MTGSNTSRRRGFTLIELLVVISIFSVAIVIFADVYILALRSQRITAARQTTVSSVRYVLEVMAQHVRTSAVDYSFADYAGGVPAPTKHLALIDQKGQHVLYQLTQGIIDVTIGDRTYALTNVTDVVVSAMQFYINPSHDPFTEQRCNKNAGSGPFACGPTAVKCSICPDKPGDCGSAPATGYCQCNADADCQTGFCDPVEKLCVPMSQQPLVTILLTFQDARAAREAGTISVQTSVASRIYKR